MNDLERILNLAGVKYEAPEENTETTERVLKEGVEQDVELELDEAESVEEELDEAGCGGSKKKKMNSSEEKDDDKQIDEAQVDEDDIEEGSIKYMHSLKAKGKSMEEIAKELDMSVDEVKQAMNKTDESVEDTEEVIAEDEKKDAKMPSKAHIMKMCKDGKTKKEICDMHPDCDQGKLKDMIDDCMDDMKKEDVKEEALEESPTMDTTQLIHLLKLSGISEEKIEEHIQKVTEAWANTPEGVGEEEPTVHGDDDNYNFSQAVNLSLKRYLDAQDMKVTTISEGHTIESMRAQYDAMKDKK